MKEKVEELHSNYLNDVFTILSDYSNDMKLLIEKKRQILKDRKAKIDNKKLIEQKIDKHADVSYEMFKIYEEKLISKKTTSFD